MATVVKQGLTVQRVVTTTLPTRHGRFELLGYSRPPANGDQARVEHTALVHRTPTSAAHVPVVRVHSECFTGDSLGSSRCDCGDQLDAALHAIAASPGGALIYALGHEGRGIGLLGKLQAYALQDQGADTVDANLALGFPAEARDYSLSAAILHDLGMGAIQLLSANPAKSEALRKCGITVLSRVGMHVRQRPENAEYLATKRRRMRHDPPPTDAWTLLRQGQLPASLDPEGEDLVARYGPFLTGPVVLAQLGQSIDGFIASATGDFPHITGDEDREHLHRLRALVDAVVVGANTVIADDCALTVRAVTGANPTRILLDPRGRIPPTARVLTDGRAPTLWLTSSGYCADVGEHVTVRRLPRADFAPERLVPLLAQEGYERLLIEGGGRTVSGFVTAGQVDRLFITTAPFLIGDGVPGIRFSGVTGSPAVIRAPVRRFTLGADTCVEFHLSAPRQ